MLKPFGMKAILKISILLLLPLIGFTQQGNVNQKPKTSQAGNVRFTDQYGPYYDTYQQENDFANKKSAPYAFVRDADVYWKKVTWEIIDLREKQNLSLYYPIDTLHGRKSLINVIIDGIKNNQFTAFKTPLNSNAFEFDPANIMSYDEAMDIGKKEIPMEEYEIRPGVKIDTSIISYWKPEEIKQILIKEVWFIDKKDSRLKNEILGICPIREFDANGVSRRERLFWIYYPDARPYFATIPVYNTMNDKPLYSFDDVFVLRYFNSYFVQEANVYNNRMITDYVIGREAQRESDRIKQEIFDKEQDMWEN